ncbi:NlpC/P60 family protein [Psychrobacillus sp. FSL H8-0483]|uniref:NlpC/P60 family protein n=1 Tax=Psychrobacillus sp. FSL H8-0483 TaxID=2921389 RepID=UPI00315ADF5A
MYKKLLAIFIVLVLVAVPNSKALAESIFQDVTDKYSSKAEFDYLIEKGILKANPEVNFGINEGITRIQAVEILVQALNLDLENRPVPTFADIKPEDEKFPLIAAIVDEKIMSGNENWEFKPNDKLTRGQMAAILVNAFNLTGTTDELFKDVPTTYWAFESIQVLVANKIISVYPNNIYKPTAFITKSDFVVLLARILNPTFRKDVSTSNPVLEQGQTPVSCEKPSETKTYKVNVQVTSLWNKPNTHRTVDRPSLTNPVDIPKWTKDMNLTQKWWLVGKIDTQALYGDEVTVLKSSGNWYQIAVKDQFVPYQKAGYPGWVPKSHVTKSSTDYTDCSIAIVTSKLATLHNLVNKKKFMDISFSTILPVLKEEGEWLHIQTPGNGVKLLKKEDAKTVKSYKDVPKPTQAEIVYEAKRFLGLPYLWAGTSALGYDCSGIIYAVYKAHGILIPRDSFYQATKGTPVAKKNLQPGDLVFFAGNGGKGKVYHVGLYIGSGKMLHAPHASSKVKIEAIDAGNFKRNYSGARRYLE